MPILPKFCPIWYTLLHMSKLKEIALALSWDICSWKLPNFLHSFLHKYIYLSCVKIWNTNNAHLGLYLLEVLRNSKKKIEGAMFYIISQFVVTPTRCSINAMHLPNTNNIMLLKVDHFEGFSNRSNVDELVINSTSGCNCNNHKLNNNVAWKQCSLILSTL